MHCALTGQLTRSGEGLGEGLSGTDVEDADDMTAVVLVDDADRLSDRDLEFGGEDVDALAAGRVRVTVNQTYAMKDAARAHADIEARKTTGSTVLIP